MDITTYLKKNKPGLKMPKPDPVLRRQTTPVLALFRKIRFFFALPLHSILSSESSLLSSVFFVLSSEFCVLSSLFFVLSSVFFLYAL
jgi:hypothetical protein